MQTHIENMQGLLKGRDFNVALCGTGLSPGAEKQKGRKRCREPKNNIWNKSRRDKVRVALNSSDTGIFLCCTDQIIIYCQIIFGELRPGIDGMYLAPSPALSQLDQENYSPNVLCCQLMCTCSYLLLTSTAQEIWNWQGSGKDKYFVEM